MLSLSYASHFQRTPRDKLLWPILFVWFFNAYIIYHFLDMKEGAKLIDIYLCYSSSTNFLSLYGLLASSSSSFLLVFCYFRMTFFGWLWGKISLSSVFFPMSRSRLIIIMSFSIEHSTRRLIWRSWP